MTPRITLLLLLVAAITATRAEDFKLTADEQSVVDLTNAERKTASLPPLKVNAKLVATARGHSANMAKENKMEHELYGKSNADRMAAAGYKSIAGRENIGFDFKTPKAMVDGWMKSPHHHDNILADDVTEIGVGIVNDKEGRLYYTQVLGRPESDLITIKYWVRNATRKPLAVDMGEAKPSMMKPGDGTTFSVFGPSPQPTVVFKSDEQTVELKLQNNQRLIAEIKDGKLVVQPAPPGK
jgi:hypothetical protein